MRRNDAVSVISRRGGSRLRSVAMAATLLAVSGAGALGQGNPEQIARTLAGASEGERAAIIARLAPHGEAAVDTLLRLMAQGELEQRIALQAIARIQSGDVAAAGGVDAGADTSADGLQPMQVPQTQAEAGKAFPAHPDFAPRDPQDAQSRLDESLTADSGSVFLPGQWLGPLTTALLLLESQEGSLPHVRYRMIYAVDRLPSGAGGGTLPVSYIEITRFNLGPERHAAIAEAAGEVPVAPVEHFGVGPHVSLRLVTRPIQGRSSDLIGLSRAEVGEDAAREALCLGQPCMSPNPLVEAALGADWGAMESVSTGGFDPPYRLVRDGVHSPAAVIDLLTREAHLAQERSGGIGWDGFEPREGLEPMEPFAEVMVETGLGQDTAVDAVLREGHVMDHTVETIWHRLVSLPGADSTTPQLFGTQALEHRAGQH